MASSLLKKKKQQRKTLIQAKLTIGQPNDRYEQEADRVADQVMRMPKKGVPLQRICEDCGEESLQMKPLIQTITPLVQRKRPSNGILLRRAGWPTFAVKGKI